MTPRAAAAALALALAGCGGDAPEDVVRETAENLGEIRSGVLSLDVRAEGRGAGSTADVGFALKGPFSLAEPGGLPVAKLAYTQRNGDASQTATFISTGKRAWIQTGGATTELTGARADGLRAAEGAARKGLGGLGLDRWLSDARLVEGDATDRVSGRLDLGRALDDIAALLGRDGGLDEEARKQLRKAVKSAPVSLWTGSEDRLLRRLDADVRLELSVAESVREQLGDLVGGRLKLRVRIDRPNEPVKVDAPVN